MMLHKGKHSFWSQLLVSMIAMFALPEVQSIEPTSTAREYQNQSIQQQVLRTIYQVQQQTAVQIPEISPIFDDQKCPKITPQLLVTKPYFAHAPIRGSPVLA